MPKFRKRPVEIEAVQWTGRNHVEVSAFTSPAVIEFAPATVLIHTLEGVMRADVRDWIIRGVKGEVYPCKPDIFEETYEAV